MDHGLTTRRTRRARAVERARALIGRPGRTASTVDRIVSHALDDIAVDLLSTREERLLRLAEDFALRAGTGTVFRNHVRVHLALVFASLAARADAPRPSRVAALVAAVALGASVGANLREVTGLNDLLRGLAAASEDAELGLCAMRVLVGGLQDDLDVLRAVEPVLERLRGEREP